ncbi:hypothetical protein [Hyphobacterium sp.]|uniref:hypothetical protein n=1 Tax=Hyphobacterium sp. TaxID=2004662 RepID=UPI0037485B38
MTDEIQLSPKEAYIIMHRFLVFEWKLRGSPKNEFSEFLGSSAIDSFVRAGTADPAIWDDWMRFVSEFVAESEGKTKNTIET